MLQSVITLGGSSKENGQLHDQAPFPTRRLLGVLGLLNFSDHQFECLDDVLVVSCRSLRPRAIPLGSQGLALFCRDLALDVQV
jgi:hypothetical protein